MKPFLLSLIILFAAFMLFNSTVSANTPYRVTRVAADDVLNIRAEPDADSAIVGQIPHNGQYVTLSGASQAIGRSTWVQIDWQGLQGWVNDAYLARMPASTSNPTSTEPEPAAPASRPASRNDGIVRERRSGMWILECGNANPYWRLDVLPKWIRGQVGEHKTGLAITHKHQEHGLYNRVALKTELRGANRWNQVELDLTYTGRCRSSLLREKVSFAVKGQYNNTVLSGCCRAMQVP